MDSKWGLAIICTVVFAIFLFGNINSASNDITINCFYEKHDLVDNELICNVTANYPVNYESLINITTTDILDYKVYTLEVVPKVVYDYDWVDRTDFCLDGWKNETTCYDNGNGTSCYNVGVFSCGDVKRNCYKLIAKNRICKYKSYEIVGSHIEYEKVWQPYEHEEINTSEVVYVGNKKLRKKILKAVNKINLNSGETKTVKYVWKNKFVIDDGYKNIGYWHMNPSSWWDESWERCITFTTTDSFPENYTHRIILNTTITNNYYGFNENGTDIRFFEGNCTEPNITAGMLGYWRESWNTSGNSTLWVKTVNANVTQIAMYFNNSEAEDVSNISEAFLFGDDFLGNSLDTNKWNYYTYGDGKYSVSDGFLLINVTTSDASMDIWSKETFDANDGWIAVRYKANYLGFDISKYAFECIGLSSCDHGAPWKCINSIHALGRRSVGASYNGFLSIQNSTYLTKVDWSDIKIDEMYYYTLATNGSVLYGIVDGNKTALNQSEYILPLPVAIFTEIGSGNVELIQLKVDYIAVSKYVDPEPTWTAGSIELANQPPIIHNLTLIPNVTETKIGYNITFNCSVNVSDNDIDLLNITFKWLENGNEIPELTSTIENVYNGTFYSPLNLTSEYYKLFNNYTCSVNITDGVNVVEQNSTTVFINNTIPVINYNATYYYQDGIAENVTYGYSYVIVANVTDADNDTVFVNFTLVRPDGVFFAGLCNKSGINYDEDMWNSTMFTIENKTINLGIWNWTILACDSWQCTTSEGHYNITDETPPRVEITSPAEDTVPSNKITCEEIINIEFIAVDDVELDTCKIVINYNDKITGTTNIVNETINCSEPYQFNCPKCTTYDNNYTVYLTVNDTSGNTNSTEKFFYVVYTTEPVSGGGGGGPTVTAPTETSVDANGDGDYWDSEDDYDGDGIPNKYDDDPWNIVEENKKNIPSNAGGGGSPAPIGKYAPAYECTALAGAINFKVYNDFGAGGYTLYMLPGKSVTKNFYVENNGTQNVALLLSLYSNDTSHTWMNLSDKYIEVTIGTKEKFSVTFNVPENVTAGEYHPVILFIDSESQCKLGVLPNVLIVGGFWSLVAYAILKAPWEEITLFGFSFYKIWLMLGILFIVFSICIYLNMKYKKFKALYTVLILLLMYGILTWVMLYI